MTNTTTLKAIALATVITVTTSLSSTAFAHDFSKADENIAAPSQSNGVTKSNARNLVKALLKREYKGDGYEAKTARKVGDKWIVTIKNRARTVATASVDTKTGNIHIN